MSCPTHLRPPHLASLPEREVFEHLPDSVRESPLSDVEVESHLIRRLENPLGRPITIGEVVDADLKGELPTWSGMGPIVQRRLREAILKLARKAGLSDQSVFS